MTVTVWSHYVAIRKEQGNYDEKVATSMLTFLWKMSNAKSLFSNHRRVCMKKRLDLLFICQLVPCGEYVNSTWYVELLNHWDQDLIHNSCVSQLYEPFQVLVRRTQRGPEVIWMSSLQCILKKSETVRLVLVTCNINLIKISIHGVSCRFLLCQFTLHL